MPADDGVVGGRRILPAGWVRLASSRTLASPYAAGFWLGAPAWRARWGLPEDAFFAHGHLGQMVFIVPSEHLVVARFGATHIEPSADIEGLGRLVRDVRAALARGASSSL